MALDNFDRRARQIFGDDAQNVLLLWRCSRQEVLRRLHSSDDAIDSAAAAYQESIEETLSGPNDALEKLSVVIGHQLRPEQIDAAADLMKVRISKTYNKEFLGALQSFAVEGLP